MSDLVTAINRLAAAVEALNGKPIDALRHKPTLIPGQCYTILSTTAFYQSYVGKVLEYQGQLNAHWNTWIDRQDASGKAMPLHLSVDTEVAEAKVVFAPPGATPAEYPIITAGDLTEADIGETFEVIQGGDDSDETQEGVRFRIKGIKGIAYSYHGDSHYAQTDRGHSSLHRDTIVRRVPSA